MDRAIGTQADNSERFWRKWRSLPAPLQTQQQLAGIAAVACGATHSVMEKCNFNCTSCYLSEEANRAQPLPFKAVVEQLDQLRDYLGDGGKCQITSGEVTLLEVAELGRIVEYARAIGLDPMVMSNGQRFLQDEDYLPTLVAQHGLEKVSLHIDSTQKGRPGWRPGMSEVELHPLRDRFAALIRDVRRQTGRSLHAATTVTITADNFADIPDIVRWSLHNAGSVRMLTLLPVAGVGRTRDNAPPLSMDALWDKICEGVGRPLNRQAMLYGHPECNITVPVVVVCARGEVRIVEVVRSAKRWDRRVMRTGLGEFSEALDLNAPLAVAAARFAWALVRRPWRLSELLAYALYRAWSERAVAGALLRGVLGGGVSVRPLLLVVHKFMNAAELDTDCGRERLQACVFRVPFKGAMISMCEMNVRFRLQVNRANFSARSRFG